MPPRYFAKGCYFTLSGRSPFSHLVYPAPGRVEPPGCAPDARPRRTGASSDPSFRWVDDLDHSIDEPEAAHFYDEVRRYWPALPDGALQPGYTGVRPKIRGPGEPAQDFRIDGPRQHGVPGLVNLFGIESPGLTVVVWRLPSDVVAGADARTRLKRRAGSDRVPQLQQRPTHARGLRLFIALWPTPAVRARVVRAARCDSLAAAARVVSDQRLHLTLHFIGPVPSALWPHSAARAAGALQRLRAPIGGCTAMATRLVVLPATSVPPPLSALHAALAGALAGLGLPVERRALRPHVTLARRADGAVLPVPADPLRWRSTSYVLVNSDPVDGYRVLARYGERGVTLAAAPRTATARSRPAPAPTPR